MLVESERGGGLLEWVLDYKISNYMLLDDRIHLKHTIPKILFHSKDA